MVKHFEHVTVVVRDVETAKRFFSLLGFEHEQSVVISGEVFSDYMGVPGIEAEHVTMVLAGAVPRTEVQLLAYRAPEATPNPTIEQLNTIGYNHVCFAVEDIEGEVRRLVATGIETRTKVLDFHGRKLVFLRGPEGITVELSERYEPRGLLSTRALTNSRPASGARAEGPATARQAMDDTDYALGRTNTEYERLIEQAELMRPLTERTLRAGSGARHLVGLAVTLFAALRRSRMRT